MQLNPDNWCLEFTPDDYKNILENCYDEVMVVNAKGVVVYINEASERNYGLCPSEMIGRTVNDLGAQGYYRPVIAPLVFKEKKTVTLEQETNRGVKLAVTVKPIFDKKGNIKYIVANSRDISQIERLKHDLEKTKIMVHKFQTEVEELRKKQIVYESMFANSKLMRQCLELAEKVAASDTTVLILGESGTGKNVMAKHIHKISGRLGPFLSINCAAIPAYLLESELFGYRRGAFTGANSDKVGLIELTNDGTIFLDEIAEIPINIQAKILEFIQEKQFIPIGGKVHKKINSRIIAATNRDLAQLVKKGEFREDLYYRLNVIELKIPPLRDRQEDIPLFIKHFLDQFNKQYNKYCTINNKCMDVLMKYHWPGNVRELEHLTERMVLTVQGEKINIDDLPGNVYQTYEPVLNQESVCLDQAIEGFIKKLVIETYKQHRSSYKLAKALNITQPRAYRLICKYIVKTG